jgi:hypothetical protein
MSIDTNGGEPPFAAVCTKVSYAQKVYFAKSRGRPKPSRCRQRPDCALNISRQFIEFGYHTLLSSFPVTITLWRICLMS